MGQLSFNDKTQKKILMFKLNAQSVLPLMDMGMQAKQWDVRDLRCEKIESVYVGPSLTSKSHIGRQIYNKKSKEQKAGTDAPTYCFKFKITRSQKSFLTQTASPGQL